MLVMTVIGVAVALVAARILAAANRSSRNAEGVVILTTGFQRTGALASLGVVALMLRAGYRLLPESGPVLLEAARDTSDLAAVSAQLAGSPHGQSLHAGRVWTVTSDLPALSAHVVLAGSCFPDGHAPPVLDALPRCLKGCLDVAHSTVRIRVGQPRRSRTRRPSLTSHTRYAYLVSMSIRHGLLALLEHGPRYGYQLRGEFEAHTGATWALNVGQVYTTLDRLARDGLAVAAGQDEEGHQLYAITDAGRCEVRSWFVTPVRREKRPRDELAIKLAFTVVTPGVDVGAVIQTQRTDTLRALQDYTRLKAAAGEEDLAWLLVVDSMIFQAEAEVRWLDHCEARLVRHRQLDRSAVATPDAGRAPGPTPAPSRGGRAARR